ncbi:MAG: hypothetical protein K8S23_11955 [Candidatus Cloacimonetes bacterium]|nr:hypothetical protein [Candidatus Cloacimonadota bacterium]
MKYINLNLKKIDTQNEEIVKFDKVIELNQIVIILGAPGSGKSSILNKYNIENEETQYVTVKKFLKLNKEVNKDTQILLLDGLDEYRSTSNDKALVISKLGNKIQEILSTRCLKIAISCRELDWFGEYDKNALKNEINTDVVLYRILPLNNVQIKELAKILSVDKSEIFIQKFSKFGFLDNPQMFFMLSKIYKNDPEKIINSKKELYLNFINNSRESNPEYTLNEQNTLSQEEVLKYTGYLALYYIFSNVDNITTDLIDEISNIEYNYRKESLEKVLRTKLFSDETFIHRTIAEFTAAYFIYNQKLAETEELNSERIIRLFINNNRVPTELRGTYSWLCALTENLEFIKYDPYYQAIHGDNSYFNNILKEKIILEVKKYSEVNPYFFDFSQKIELEGFYNEDLDDLLIKQFRDALNLKNHYIYFIINIITSSQNHSCKMLGFIKKMIIGKSVQPNHKYYFIGIFKTNISFLKKVLYEIKSKSIDDANDSLKEFILRNLYPTHINQDELIQYLILYNKHKFYYCNYLYTTSYADKYSLIDSIFQIYKKNDIKLNSHTPDNVKFFIEDYFLETILKYDESISAKQIFDIFTYFNSYQNWHKNIKFNSNIYRESNVDKTKLNKLASDLYLIYIDQCISDESHLNYIPQFSTFFPYTEPNNRSDLLMSKMNSSLGKEINENLFYLTLCYMMESELKSERVEIIASKYGFNEILANKLNPTKSHWEIDRENFEKKAEIKFQKEIQDNEVLLRGKNDNEILCNFNMLHYLSLILYIDNDDQLEKHFTHDTSERLLLIMKSAIEHPVQQEFLTLNSLASDAPDANRNIDIVYYVSLCLNDYSSVNDIKDKEIKKYLLINNLIHMSIGNIRESNFYNISKTNNKEFVFTTLKEYIHLLTNFHLSQCANIFKPLISIETDFGNLEKIIHLFDTAKNEIKDCILSNLLIVYGFDLSLSSLRKVEHIETNEKNISTIAALIVISEEKREQFTRELAISLHLLFRDDFKKLGKLSEERKATMIDFMLDVFNTSESLKTHNGFQSNFQQCSSFLSDYSLDILSLKSLNKVLENHNLDSDIWKNKILHHINNLNQSKADSIHGLYPVKDLSNFLLANDILSYEDFFHDICLKLEKLTKEIKDNRNNDKDSFYNQDQSKKNEESGRDNILRRLRDKYNDDLILTKEVHEANNRVDINIKYSKNTNYEIQIECKRDDNAEINYGIKYQLIDKYFSSKVQYGIYLIFYFGSKKDKQKMLDKIDKNIPIKYINNIKVICLDLTLKNKKK